MALMIVPRGIVNSAGALTTNAPVSEYSTEASSVRLLVRSPESTERSAQGWQSPPQSTPVSVPF